MTKSKKLKKVRKIKKPGNKTIVIESPIAPGQKLTIASELADDNMIEREMMGEVLPHFIYQFPQDGKVVSGLSVKGVNEVVRRLNKDPRSGTKIHINPAHLRIERDVEMNGEKGVEVWVFAEDLVSGNSGWGTKFEAYFKTGRKGKYPNTFALEKALSKAERNAKRKLIAETLAVKMIERMIKSDPSTVRQIEAPKFQSNTVPIKTPVKSTPADLEAEFVRVLRRDWKNAGKLIELADTLSNSNFRPKFKTEINKQISVQVDKLEN